MMKTRFLTAAALALVVAGPASAQLLGGSLGGGLGGSLGGGMGGGMGGLGGTLGGTIERGRAGADATARGATRIDRTRRSARVMGDAQLDARALGERRIAATSSTDAALSLDRTRGAVAAGARGLRRAVPTASGVQVFAAPLAATSATVGVASATTPPTAIAVAAPAYPAYAGGYYYEPGAVFVEHRYVDTYMDRQQRDLEGSLRGTGASVTRRGDDLVVMLPADVTFAFDKADVRPRFYGTLDAFARTMQAYPGTDVEIVGHTDAIGSDAYNLSLSERRGRSVADFLVGRYVAPARLVVEAMGEAEPIASNATVDGRAANRRVELIVHPRAG